MEMIPAITKLTPLRNCGHFTWYQNDNFIVLTLDKAYTTYLSHEVIMLNYSVLFIICQNTKYFWNVIFTFYFLSAQQSLLHSHCLCYLLHVKTTFYLTPRFYVLLILRTLNEDRERVRCNESCLCQGNKHVPKLCNCNQNYE